MTSPFIVGHQYAPLILTFILYQPIFNSAFSSLHLQSRAVLPTTSLEGGRRRTHLYESQNDNLWLPDDENEETESRRITRYQTSAEKEFLNEEKRRLERKNDVVIGKTSAIPDAVDFDLDPDGTEKALMSSMDDGSIERKIHELTEEGLEALRLLQLEKSHMAFEQVYQYKPDIYLWQHGVVLFYLNKTHDAAKSFCRSAKIYEKRFGEPASEERIWRDACELKLLAEFNAIKRSRKVVEVDEPSIPKIDDDNGDDEADEETKKDSRKVVRIARDLFSATVEQDFSKMLLSRAKLRSICGKVNNNKRRRVDMKMWKHSSWYYLGLHFDVLEEKEESKACMKMALLQTVGTMHGNDITKNLPVIHMSRRDWYDDDEFDVDLSDGNDNGVGILSNDILEIFKAGVKKMRVVDLKKELKRKGFGISGAKKELQERLTELLAFEAEIDPDILMS